MGEFSVEIILSVLEMDQFQRSVLRHYCARKGCSYNSAVREIKSYFNQNTKTPATPSTASPEKEMSVTPLTFQMNLRPSSKSKGSQSGETNLVGKIEVAD